MTGLVVVKCPRCGAKLDIDAELDFATCQYCNTRSVVSSRTRPVSPQLQERFPLIQVPAKTHGWSLAVFGLVVLGGLTAMGTMVFDRIRQRFAVNAAVPATESAPLAPTPTLSPPATPSATAVSATKPPDSMWGDSAPSEVAGTRAPASGSSRPAPAKLVPAAKPPNGRVSVGQLTVSGRLGASEIRPVVDRNSSRFRMCYEQGLARSPVLAGSVTVRFVIGRDGSVSNVSNGGSDLSDSSVVGCVLSAFYGLRFPAPPGGIVTVVYPLHFRVV
jgi:DNA-directed RNA polymerase subunit RPC12/RpoP